MATRHRASHFLFGLIAPWIESLKRQIASGAAGGGVTGTSASTTPGAGGSTAPAFTGTAPTRAVGSADIASGTGFATAGQVVTTTETTFTATLNQYAGCWLLAATQAPCLIVSHPAVTAGALALTVQGLAPTTDVGGFRILGAPTPAGTVAAHTHTGAAHTHGAGTFAAAPASGAVHYDQAEYAVTAANASSLATSRALLKALLVATATHGEDVLAHNTVDDMGEDLRTLEEAALTGTGGLCDYGNNLKAALNTHFTASGVHPTDDVVRTISSPDATDQSSLNTLLNEIKADLNAHMADGFAVPSWRVGGV